MTDSVDKNTLHIFVYDAVFVGGGKTKSRFKEVKRWFVAVFRLPTDFFTWAITMPRAPGVSVTFGNSASYGILS